MRCPLTTVLFFLRYIVKYLEMENLSKANIVQALDYCTLIKSQVTFCQTFVDDLLDLQKIGTSALQIVKEAFDPNTVIETISSIFKAQAKKKGITLTCVTKIDN